MTKTKSQEKQERVRSLHRKAKLATLIPLLSKIPKKELDVGIKYVSERMKIVDWIEEKLEKYINLSSNKKDIRKMSRKILDKILDSKLPLLLKQMGDI